MLNSETQAKHQVDGCLLMFMTTKKWTQEHQRTGWLSKSQKLPRLPPAWSSMRSPTMSLPLRRKLPNHVSPKLRFQHRVFGKTEMASASGEDSESPSILSTQRDMSVTGKTPKSQLNCKEFTSCSMMKIQENLLKGLPMHIRPEPWLIHSLSTTSTSRTCQLTKFQRLRMTKWTEF